MARLGGSAAGASVGHRVPDGGRGVGRATTPEILQMCSDIRVLGKRDIQALLRWRQRMCTYTNELARLQQYQSAKGAQPATLPTNDAGPERGVGAVDASEDEEEEGEEKEDRQLAASDADPTALAYARELDTKEALAREEAAQSKRLRKKLYKKRLRARLRMNLQCVA